VPGPTDGSTGDRRRACGECFLGDRFVLGTQDAARRWRSARLEALSRWLLARR